MDAFSWAHQQFWPAPLPDLRLRRRLVEVAACIRGNPTGTLPRAIADCAALKGAYRLFSHVQVTHAGILENHVGLTRNKCRETGSYLLIEDTTSLSFSQREAVAGMGPLTHDTSQGLLVHTCLGVRLESQALPIAGNVTLAGLFGQECWARETPVSTRAARKRLKRPCQTGNADALESGRWGRALREAGRPPVGAQWTLVADRESDIFRVLAQCKAQGADWIIRAAQPRNTLSGEDVFRVAAGAPLLSAYLLPLRARPGVAARDAQIQLRASSCALRPPAGQRAHGEPLETGLVELREANPPEGSEGIHWLLLTSWPCSTPEEAQRVCEGYTQRWLVEEYHKALKTGTSIESTQLCNAESIEALLAIHAVVAAELLSLKLIANAKPDETSEHLVSAESLKILEMSQGRPAQGWTNRGIINAVAKMGGYLGRKNDGPPGWLSIWRGWQRLMLMTDGFHTAMQQLRSG